ncbi:MAG: hypothetical protein KDC58_07175 [Cyclobacteriaceae bacterium]|nr:hypothetical protein [Cyclobacteriaceae bacterium]
MTTPSSGPQKTKTYFLVLSAIHLALFTGQFLFGIVAYYMNSTGDMTVGNEELNQMFLVVIPLVAIGGIVGGIFLSKNQIGNIRQKQNLREKLTAYQTVLIIKYALLEGPSFLAIAGYLLTGNTIFMAIAAVIILLFIMNRPSTAKTITELELNQTEREIVENPEALLED